MKVKCIIDEYFDRELDKYVRKNETLEMDEKRAKYLIAKGYIQEIKSNKEAKDVK